MRSSSEGFLKVTEASLTYVAIDESGQPKAIQNVDPKP
jgi:acyl-CoA hydrolase